MSTYYEIKGSKFVWIQARKVVVKSGIARIGIGLIQVVHIIFWCFKSTFSNDIYTINYESITRGTVFFRPIIVMDVTSWNGFNKFHLIAAMFDQIISFLIRKSSIPFSDA